MRSMDLSYLADTLFTVKLVPGGACHPVRNPSALETIEMGQFAGEGNEQDRLTLALDLLGRLMPSAPKDEVRAMPPAQIIKILTAVGEAARAVQLAGETDLPNGKGGPTHSPTPETLPAMSSTGSPRQPGEMYGPS